jgi:hypothetical protein
MGLIIIILLVNVSLILLQISEPGILLYLSYIQIALVTILLLFTTTIVDKYNVSVFKLFMISLLLGPFPAGSLHLI